MITLWMIMSFGVTVIDAWAHLGGLLFGVLMGVAIWAPENEASVLINKVQPSCLFTRCLFNANCAL
jgi:membrane associated rhomboid family serine protease